MFGLTEFAFVLVAISWTTTILHEVAHFALAGILGIHVAEVNIGKLPIWKPTWFGIRWRFGPVLTGGSVQIHGENCACDDLMPDRRIGALHCAPPHHQLLVAAAGPTFNALVLLGVSVWSFVTVITGNDVPLRSFAMWVQGLHQLLIANRTGNVDLEQAATEMMASNWDQGRVACALALGGLISFLVLLTNLPPIPMTDGWHISRARKEMRGEQPLSQRQWEAKKLEQRRYHRLLFWCLVPIAAVLVAIRLFY